MAHGDMMTGEVATSSEPCNAIGALDSLMLGNFAGRNFQATVSVDGWPTPTTHTHQYDTHSIIFFPRKHFEGTIRYADMESRSRRRASNVFFRHAGFPLVGNGTGGRHRVARYHFSPERLREVIQDDFKIREDDISRALDLSEAPLLPILTRLTDELVNPGLASSALLDAGITTLLIELARFTNRRDTGANPRATLSRSQLTIVRDRVNAHHLPAPAVAELAKLAGVSERHLLRLFRATTSETVSAYIRRSLSERAQQMLEKPSMPIKVIAFELGYTSVPAFTTAFRKSVGETPGQYRARMIGNFPYDVDLSLD